MKSHVDNNLQGLAKGGEGEAPYHVYDKEFTRSWLVTVDEVDEASKDISGK